MYDIDHICHIVKGRLLINTATSEINQIAIDSRKINFSQETVFIAIKTERNNGHLYIQDCYQKGVRCFIVSENNTLYKTLKNTSVILVPDTLRALQQLVSAHRKQFHIPVIGITGSNGKTIIKEWIHQLLSPDYIIARSPKSYNSQIGVPLSVWQLNKNHTLGCFEAGISEPGEMKYLQPVIQPSIGIFTNIGSAHDEHFVDHAQKVAEKILLFKQTAKIIYCKDYAVLHAGMVEQIDKQSGRLFTWSRKSNADLQIKHIEQDDFQTTTIHGVFKTKKVSITIPYTDEASVENSIHCWALMLLLHYADDTISERMLSLQPVAMRLELKEGINHCSVINDSYSADLNSLAIALDFLKQQKQHTRTTVILSDLMQTGLPEKVLYEKISGLVSQNKISRLIGIGPNIFKQQKLFKGTSLLFFQTTEEFLESFNQTHFQSETILIKGARIFAFERINQLLQQRTHESVLEISLDALIHNLNYYRSLLKPQTRIMAMVKAFSYGSGSYEIASQLQFHHTDYLAVAYTDEGVELRKAGINLPVMVMNPEENTYETILAYHLEPEVYSMHVLETLDRSIGKKLIQTKSSISVHIKIDTGMHRLGFETQDIPELLTFLKAHPYIKVRSIFSHLAASEEALHDGFTKMQISTLKKIAAKIQSLYKYEILLHIANSSGITRFKEGQLDMVRLGIGLYGVSNIPEEQINLKNVSTFKTCISQIKKIPKDETVGYNRKGVLKKDTTIAIIPVGYADGIHRTLSNGKGRFYINGKTAPIIGNVCMDMCMIDVTGLAVKEGDAVIIFGEEYPITEIASQAGTIPYEILTGIARRVKRIYYQE